MPVQYDDKIVRIEQHSEVEGAEVPNTPDGKVTVKGWTNEITREFQTQGYVVLRNFIPKEVIDMTMDSDQNFDQVMDFFIDNLHGSLAWIND